MKRFSGAAVRVSATAARVRDRLRVIMPRAALVAAGLFVLWVVLANTSLNETRGDNLLDVVTFVVVCFTTLYFGLRGLRWLKRGLLWRVRRRLIITYLFIGLTPIVLLGLLALLTSLIFSGQALSRIVNVQVDTTERQALASTLILADSFSALPAGSDDRTVQRWLDDNASILQGSLPGVRLTLWRGAGGAGGPPQAAAELGQGAPAEFVSASGGGEELRGVGGDMTPAGGPLPEWLKGYAEWSGFAFAAAPEGSAETFGTPSIRALVRRETGGRPFALLTVIPVSRSLVRRYRETTGIEVKPFFVGSESIFIRSDGASVSVERETPAQGGDAAGDANPNPDGEARDQFGEPMSVANSYVVVLTATNWQSGVTDTRLAFVFGFSWLGAMRQLMTGTAVGEMLQTALLYVALAFLVLELIALMSAAWMTRAVTGTVHRLYRATEFIKRGDFSHRIGVRSHDQLGELAAAFNEMSANIEVLLQERVERERLEREVEIAAEVQAQLFPRSVPRLRSAEMAGECRAARGVAGDYYDYMEVEPGLVAFALGDVSGKGISASLVMSNLQATLRAQVAIIAERRRIAAKGAAAVITAAGLDPADTLGPCGVAGADANCAVENMVAGINQQLCASTDSNRFATLFLSLYDDRARTLRYTNAGHNAPVLVRSSGVVERLEVGGTIVGSFDFASYDEAQVSLEPGDLLLVFSDGISEAQNSLGEEYGEGRLAQLAAENRHKSAADLMRAIFEEVDGWSGASERGDDQTLVILKATPGGK